MTLPDHIIPATETGLEEILEAVGHEYYRATKLHPGSQCLMAAVTEETGELAKACLDEPIQNVQAEAIQVASTALRLALVGDPTFNTIREKKKLQPFRSEEKPRV